MHPPTLGPQCGERTGLSPQPDWAACSPHSIPPSHRVLPALPSACPRKVLVTKDTSSHQSPAPPKPATPTRAQQCFLSFYAARPPDGAITAQVSSLQAFKVHTCYSGAVVGPVAGSRAVSPRSRQGLQRLLWLSAVAGAARLLRWWGKVGMSSGSQAAGKGCQQWAGPLGAPLRLPLLPSHDCGQGVAGVPAPACPGPTAHLDGPALSSLHLRSEGGLSLHPHPGPKSHSPRALQSGAQGTWGTHAGVSL